MKHLLLSLAAASMLLSACSGKRLLDDSHTFHNDVWNRFKPEQFEASPKNNRDYYNIDFSTSVDTAVFRYSSLPLLVRMHSPAGEERSFYAEIPLKENGHWLGDTKEGRCTVRHRIRSFFSFNHAGSHRIEIGQTTSQYDLEGVHAIGIHIVRTKLDYNL